jgi:hypothetical protein
MAINGLNVGIDVRLTFTSEAGLIAIPSTRIKMFTSTQKKYARESACIDGVTRHVNIEAGWAGSFEIEKLDASVDSFFTAQEELYYAGQNIGTYGITQTITNPDRSKAIYQFTGVVFTLSDAGNWTPDNYVTQKVEWAASKRKLIG